MATRTHAIRHHRVHHLYSRVRRHHKAKMSLMVLLGMAPTVVFAAEGWAITGQGGGPQEAAHRLVGRLTGYDYLAQQWNFSEAVKGWAPILVGAVAHKLANKLGLNRMIKLPFIEL